MTPYMPAHLSECDFPKLMHCQQLSPGFRQGLMNCARHVIKRILNPCFLSKVDIL